MLENSPELEEHIITQAQKKISVLGRNQAVHIAKKLSRKSHGVVTIERADRRIIMKFRRGMLDSFMHEIRKSYYRK